MRKWLNVFCTEILDIVDFQIHWLKVLVMLCQLFLVEISQHLARSTNLGILGISNEIMLVTAQHHHQ